MKSRQLGTNVMAMCLAVFVFSSPLFAQESHKDATKSAETEMEAAFGTVPVMMKILPDHMRAGAWEWFKATQNPNSAIPAKYSQLISLGVASQIPCNYCVYAHTTMAKMLGATDAEIQEAVAKAANTRLFSTVLNGGDVSFDEFKKEWDGILAHVKKQAEAKEKIKK